MVNKARTKRQSPEQRHVVILEAAASVFFEQGYAATSIDAIIARLGGSKRNIYNEFGSKEGLFIALVTETADKALAALTIEEIEGHDIEEALTTFGRKLLDVYMSPTLIGVLRTVMAEAARFPELAKAFYDKGPGRASTRLAEILEFAKTRGEINVENCQFAAENFVGMLRDNHHLQVVLGLKSPPSSTEAASFVSHVVSIFLHGVKKR